MSRKPALVAGTAPDSHSGLAEVFSVKIVALQHHERRRKRVEASRWFHRQRDQRREAHSGGASRPAAQGLDAMTAASTQAAIGLRNTAAAVDRALAALDGAATAIVAHEKTHAR
jgi:hypothetical protein